MAISPSASVRLLPLAPWPIRSGPLACHNCPYRPLLNEELEQAGPRLSGCWGLWMLPDLRPQGSSVLNKRFSVQMVPGFNHPSQTVWQKGFLSTSDLPTRCTVLPRPTTGREAPKHCGFVLRVRLTFLSHSPFTKVFSVSSSRRGLCSACCSVFSVFAWALLWLLHFSCVSLKLFFLDFSLG